MHYSWWGHWSIFPDIQTGAQRPVQHLSSLCVCYITGRGSGQQQTGMSSGETFRLSFSVNYWCTGKNVIGHSKHTIHSHPRIKMYSFDYDKCKGDTLDFITAASRLAEIVEGLETVLFTWSQCTQWQDPPLTCTCSLHISAVSVPTEMVTHIQVTGYNCTVPWVHSPHTQR